MREMGHGCSPKARILVAAGGNAAQRRGEQQLRRRAGKWWQERSEAQCMGRATGTQV